ncbi:MAG: hypothetical protein AAGB46_04265 [Verrucomicrobiota bacterium]
MYRRAIQRAKIPLIVLLVLLQRTPALFNRAVSQFSSAGIQILQKAIFSAAALGPLHAQSGASKTQYRVQSVAGNPITYDIGDQTITHNEFGIMGIPMIIGISNNNSPAPRSWKLIGELPPGIRMTDTFEEFDLVNNVLEATFPLLIGTPTEVGNFQFQVEPWSGPGATGDSPPQTLNFAISIQPGEIPPAEAPVLNISIQDNTAILSWDYDDQAPFDLKYSIDLDSWFDPPQVSTFNGGTASNSVALNGNAPYYFRLQQANSSN